MDYVNRDKWRYYFACAVSIRLHPRNIAYLTEPNTTTLGKRLTDKTYAELNAAAAVADVMVKMENERWQSGQQSEAQPHNSEDSSSRKTKPGTTPQPTGTENSTSPTTQCRCE